MAAKKRPRRRCSECHRRFVPHNSALETQKTCCQRCRLRRRARLARERRLEFLDEYRQDERERQRASRARRRSGAGSGQRGSPARDRVSRTGLDPGLAEIAGDLLKLVDRVTELSRTTLPAARTKILKNLAELEVRVGPNEGQRSCHDPGVTDHPRSPTP
jgi:hypothetical protein